MTTVSIIENKISSLQKYLNHLKQFGNYSLEEIDTNIERRAAFERFLYLTFQTAIDLSEAFISWQKLRKPSSMRECFDILLEAGIISNELSQAMGKMVGFRNILSHDYEKIDYAIAYKVLRKDIQYVEILLDILKSRLNT